jgi:isocitrate dehydrogenase (NAD+)
VTPNLYGNLIINVGSGLVGGPGVVAGANYGLHGEAVFEPGARHVAADIQGAGVANPTGMLLSGVMLLRHIGLNDEAARLEKSISEILLRGKVLTKYVVRPILASRVCLISCTDPDLPPRRDLGGFATTKEFTKAVINHL